MGNSRLFLVSAFIFLGVVWGTTWIAIKFSLVSVPPFSGVMLRFILALFILYIYARVRNIKLRISPEDRKYIFISALLMYAGDYGVIYWAEQYLYAGVTAIFFATYPIFTGLVSNFIFRNEAFSANKFAGLLLGFIGIVIIFYDQLIITQFDTMVILASVGILFAAFCGALSTVMVKKYLDHTPIMPLTINQMFWGVLILTLIALVRGEAAAVAFSWEAFWSILYLGIIGSAVAFVLYFHLLKQMSVVSLSFIVYINPVIALLAGWVILDEKISLQTAIGSAIVLGGIALSQMSQFYTGKKREKVLEELKS